MPTLEQKFLPEEILLIDACRVSLKNFCRLILPDTFFRPFSPGHLTIIEALSDPSKQQVALCAPRGIGKSSLVQAMILKGIIFNEYRHIVLGGASYSLGARARSENIKREIEDNPQIQHFWGSLKSDKWAEDEWITAFDQRILPVGAGQKVRGALYKNHRPDLIVLDDIEDLDNTSSPENRKKVRDWLFDTILKLRDMGSTSFKIVYIGSLLHEDSLMARLTEIDEVTKEFKLPSWNPIKLELHDDNGKSFWPEYMSDERIAAEIAQAKIAGTLDGWMREMRGIPTATENSLFAKFNFLQYEESQIAEFNHRITNFVLVDPARTVKLDSDYTAMLVVGHDYETGTLYIRDLVNEKLHPNQIYEHSIQLCRKYNSNVLAIETHGLHEHLLQPLLNYMIGQGGGIQLIELAPRGGKTTTARNDLSGKNLRIAALAPMYSQGVIKHNSACCQPLEFQQRAFPRGKKDDILDCEAYIPQLFQKLGRLYLGGGGSMTPGEDEFESEARDRAECLRENRELASAGVFE